MMIGLGSNLPSVLGFMCFIFFVTSYLLSTFASPARHLCSPDERDALLEFKHEFRIQQPTGLDVFITECMTKFLTNPKTVFPKGSRFSDFVKFFLEALFSCDARPKTESWGNNSNCCSWEGVTCGAKLGKVVGIDLSLSFLNGPLRSNSSLFKLRHLLSLDLSFNNLFGDLPHSIHDLKSLNVLRLESCNLSGKIPPSLGNLSHLTSIDLSFNNLVGEVPSWMSNLNRLSELRLDANKLSGHFSLSINQLSGVLPSSLFVIPSLSTVDLADNQFTGPLEFKNISSPSNLRFLFLEYNNFSRLISESISKLTKLEHLDLSYLDLRSTIDLSIFSPLKSLASLSLSGNKVSVGNISSSSDFPVHLQGLVLSACEISEFPDFIKTQRDMVDLDLSRNQIQGQVPDWLWKLPMLQYVNLSRNSLNGFQGSPEVLPGDQIFSIDLSSNMFRGRLPTPPRSTTVLLASANNFTGGISQSICRLNSLVILDLSKNSFNGTIPRCLGNPSDTLQVLILRENSLTGRLPRIRSSNLMILDVGHNQLVGKLPESLTSCDGLQVLNVESNNMNGTFPFWLRSLPSLQVLVLRSNIFHGPISPPTGSLKFPQLRILDLSHNRFTGALPSSYFESWSAMSSTDTNEDGPKPKYMGYGTIYYHLVLTTKGVAIAMERIITTYTSIDLSGNRFEGRIPESIGLLKDLIVLNVSNNSFTGHIPGSLANLTELESLDLSLNKLSGEIPPELGSLSFLAYMNFSHNQLEGPIPQSTQFCTQPKSSFEENLGLRGPPLEESCGKADSPMSQEPQGPKTEEEEEEEEEEENISRIAAAITFAPGVVFGLTIGHIVASHKHEWFMEKLRRTNRRRS